MTLGLPCIPVVCVVSPALCALLQVLPALFVPPERVMCRPWCQGMGAPDVSTCLCLCTYTGVRLGAGREGVRLRRCEARPSGWWPCLAP